MTNVQNEENKSIGHLKQIAFDIVEPLQMRALEMSFDKASKELPAILERSGNLNILVGDNGTGKTFLLVNAWCLASIANHAIFNRQADYLKGAAQFTYDHSFSRQNITGKITAVFENAKVRMLFKKGRVEELKVSGVDRSFNPSLPTFLSSNMRTFESISQYLKVRKRIMETINSQFSEWDAQIKEMKLFSELIKDFKLYDIAHVESTIKRCPITISKELNESLRTFHDFNNAQDYKLLDVDLEECDFYVTQGRSKKKLYLSTFSKGHQAIFNMFVTLSRTT